MGTIVKYSELKDRDYTRKGLPILFSTENKKMMKSLLGKKYNEVNLNIILSSMSKKYDNFINSDMDNLLLEAMNRIHDYSIVLNFEMLFYHEYKIDPIKAFINTSRTKSLAIAWPGIIDSQKIIYSDPSYEDYYIKDLKSEVILIIN